MGRGGREVIGWSRRNIFGRGPHEIHESVRLGQGRRQLRPPDRVASRACDDRRWGEREGAAGFTAGPSGPCFVRRRRRIAPWPKTSERPRSACTTNNPVTPKPRSKRCSAPPCTGADPPLTRSHMRRKPVTWRHALGNRARSHD